MTISQALRKFSDIEIEMLLGHVLKQSKEFLYVHGDSSLTRVQLQKLKKFIEKRKKGMPIAYIIGYKYFHNLKFVVNRNVLIPRPETEQLVNEALKLIAKLEKKGKKSIKVLDVGTGSGVLAITIALKSDSKKVTVFATDISEKALGVARKNAIRLGARVRFSKHDLLAGVKGTFDIVIANLPYVPASDYTKFYDNLKFEPKIALTDGTNTSTLIQKFIEELPTISNAQTHVLLEVDPTSFKYLHPSTFKILKDFRNLNRFAILKTKKGGKQYARDLFTSKRKQV